MTQKNDISEDFRCIEWSFGPNFKPSWDNRNKEWSKNYDIDGRCTNKARPGKVTCKRCHVYYT